MRPTSSILFRWLNFLLLLCLASVELPRLPAQEISGADREFFEKSVRPLLAEHCYECHSAKEANGGLRLDSRIGVAKGGDSGAVLTAGQPSNSLLMKAVEYKDRDLQMPPKNKLTDEQISVLRRWIEKGAPDPRVPLNGPGGSYFYGIDYVNDDAIFVSGKIEDSTFIAALDAVDGEDTKVRDGMGEQLARFEIDESRLHFTTVQEILEALDQIVIEYEQGLANYNLA